MDRIKAERNLEHREPPPEFQGMEKAYWFFANQWNNMMNKHDLQFLIVGKGSKDLADNDFGGEELDMGL